MATQTTTRPANRPAGARQTPRQVPSRTTTTRAKAKQGENRPVRPFQIPFDATNIRIILIGIGVIALGYLVMYFSPTMSDMAMTVSPILLLLGYCVIVPYGIMAGIRKNRSTKTVSEVAPTTGTVNSTVNGTAA